MFGLIVCGARGGGAVRRANRARRGAQNLRHEQRGRTATSHPSGDRLRRHAPGSPQEQRAPLGPLR